MPFNDYYDSPPRNRKPPVRVAISNSRYSNNNRNTLNFNTWKANLPTINVIQSENDWLNSSLEKLSPTKRYLTVSIKIKYFDNVSAEKFRVHVGKERNKKYLIDNNKNKINCKRAIFIVSTSGMMYITPDRTSPDATVYPDGSVACHISFKCTDIMQRDEVLFAGLITVTNGVPKVLSNETGTYLTGIIHTVKVKEILERILQVHSGIELDLIVLPELFLDDIRLTLEHRQYSLVTNIMENLRQQGNDTLVEQIDQMLQQSRSQHNNDNDNGMCCVCMDQPCDIVFIPCGHLKTCGLCSGPLNNCPICRRDIQQKVPVFK